MRTRSLAHSVYQLQSHIVWGTKYRRKFLIPVVKQSLLESLYATVKAPPTLHIFTVNTDKDHVHLQLEAPPNMALSTVVQKLKSASSFVLRRRFKFVREMYLDKEGIWSVGYFVSSIGLNEAQIKKYIEWQGKREVPQTLRTLPSTPSRQARFE